MKHLAILVVFLLMGCQTNNNIAPNDITSPKPEIEQDEKAAQESDPDSIPKKERTPVAPMQVMKPVICGDVKMIFESLLNTSKELPILAWYDEKYGHKVMVLVNKKKRTTSVVEMITPEVACFLSVGIGAEMEGLPKALKGSGVSFIN